MDKSTEMLVTANHLKYNNITSLKPNQIFIFGSNTDGRHGRGAALQAFKQFGAKQGVGEGLFTGGSYAFPTLDGKLRQRLHGELVYSVEKLYHTCRVYPDFEFLLTKVGCGLAGYGEEYMKSLFVDPPDNLIMPEGWGWRG